MGLTQAAESLRDRVVLITGASGGIGGDLARSLYRSDARLALACGHNELERVSDIDPNARASVRAEVDVTSTDSINVLVDEALDRFGRIDSIVTTAGVMEQLSIDDLDESTWSKVLAVNLTGTFLTIKSALPALRRSKSASVVTLSSQLAYTGARDAVAYSASKAGVLGLTRALARELAPDIRVNSVAPGPIRTPMTARHAEPAWEKSKTDKLALGRFGETSEVVPLIEMLLSEGSSYVTGQTLSPNGGGYLS
ncbi:SDR family NAD(P)-dependent oxidoreductase [Rhodococcus sp. IEGM 1381]|uniref:SDR family NAD(P)-dependent oxidoreductase n=1 Tax=Rhodococcus sp. IEGM 1381 TaxID=3047085 RepID=UPI0024B71929|nr:SDR family NAD(P)-dependent oxidoreductase [Rhodococcus sp. IEGM 1381]MDI9897460.1 SDR family NAD(P)-dependent oxidoreductase [Rhodococcus sp. IEGM 1381]